MILFSNRSASQVLDVERSGNPGLTFQAGCKATSRTRLAGLLNTKIILCTYSGASAWPLAGLNWRRLTVFGRAVTRDG
jgi:hypothetical protein